MLLQLALAAIGSMGFSMIFHLRARLWPVAAFSGFISWAVYLLCSQFWDGVFLPSFLAAAFSALYGEVLARVFKAPATIFFIPALVPLIPGGSLYHTMSYLVRREWAIAKIYSAHTMQAALAIAVGGSLVWALCIMASKIRHHYWPGTGSERLEPRVRRRPWQKRSVKG